MDWIYGDEYYERTKEGYNVACAIVAGENVYTAFGPKDRANNINILKGRCMSIDEAKAVCEEHYRYGSKRR